MGVFQTVLEAFIHIDKNLVSLISNYGFLIYPILFIVVFCETGLVVIPFLPGDSLIFVAGTLAAKGLLNLFLLFIVLFFAAVIGDSVNYSIGKFFGPKIFSSNSRMLNKGNLQKAQNFMKSMAEKP